MEKWLPEAGGGQRCTWTAEATGAFLHAVGCGQDPISAHPHVQYASPQLCCLEGGGTGHGVA